MGEDDLDPVHPAIEQALTLGGDRHAITEYYEAWADEYDADVGAEEYGVKDVIVDLLRSVDGAAGLAISTTDRAIEILDAGCGTGQIGARLAGDGYTAIDGVDLSDAMAEKARERGVYRSVRGSVDLMEPVDGDEVGTYDACLIGGVFTLGHAPPELLARVIDRVRRGGALVVSVREAYYDTTEYDAVARQLIDDGRLTLVGEVLGARYTFDSRGHYFAYAVG